MGGSSGCSSTHAGHLRSTRGAQALALALFAGVAVAQQHAPNDDDDPGDDPSLEDMIRARNTIERTVIVDQDEVAAIYTVYDIDGNIFTPNSTGYYNMLPYNPYDNLEFTELNFTNALFTPYGGFMDSHSLGPSATAYHNIPLEDRPVNNLGGLGPNNGVYTTRFATPSDISPADYQAHPNFIRLNQISTFKGQNVSMRIDNCSEYVPARPSMNDFNGFNFQLNLRPLYNFTAGAPGSFQPFVANSLIMAQFVREALQVNLLAENCNSVSLFYSFFDQDTGRPIELEEVHAALAHSKQLARPRHPAICSSPRIASPAAAPSRSPLARALKSCDLRARGSS